MRNTRPEGVILKHRVGDLPSTVTRWQHRSFQFSHVLAFRRSHQHFSVTETGTSLRSLHTSPRRRDPRCRL